MFKKIKYLITDYLIKYGIKKPKVGLVPQKPDARDYSFKDAGIRASSGSSEYVDLEDCFDKVINQSPNNSCVGCAAGDLLEYNIRYRKILMKWDEFDVSKNFIWFVARLEEGSEDENVGVVLRNTFKAIRKWGFVREEQYPLSKKYYEQPAIKTLIEGGMFKNYLKTLPRYYALSGTSSVKLNQAERAIRNKMPIVFGLPLYTNFYHISRSKPFLDEFDGGFHGYHAMLIIGETKDYFKVRNSWGTSFGRKGYFYLKKECK